jgi:hypothetical protein
MAARTASSDCLGDPTDSPILTWCRQPFVRSMRLTSVTVTCPAVHSPMFDVMNTSAVVNPFDFEAFNVAAYAYDCVVAFAVAFSRSNDFNNGAEVAARFREARFDGATGQVHFDLQGDRDPSTINCMSLRIVPVACCEKMHIRTARPFTLCA